jgi:cell wall-associated NlpC family hydrolase
VNLDPRENAYRPDLADARLKGTVAAERFVEGIPRAVRAPSAPLKRTPRPDAPLDSELLRGECVLVFEEAGEGWSWVQNLGDRYVGYVPTDTLGEATPATHKVTALRTFIYPGPDMKLPAVAALSFGSAIRIGETVETRGTKFYLLPNGEGAVVARHLAPVDAAPEADFVAVAERFIETPYLWGGRTSLGLDCSALVQLSLVAAGVPAPRDTDMQQASLGLPATGDFQRGDLVFWRGHVAILVDREATVHASGHHMAVVHEKLAAAVARMGAPAAVKRLAHVGRQ